jgi:hypothetical protein
MCIMHMMPGPSSDGEFNTYIQYMAAWSSKQPTHALRGLIKAY